uniref:Uncharacterized protein n=1 Tax=Nelumbo nucifera TaxID=4432 RepID=A0A822XZB8_NELNU|nr:TPA_asm: hypothetical protein HUJ06_025618 [Nelumbo nucifera]
MEGFLACIHYFLALNKVQVEKKKIKQFNFFIAKSATKQAFTVYKKKCALLRF